MEADDELEDHDQDQDRDADVHVEGLAAHGDVLGVLRLLSDAGRRLVDVSFQLVEEAELLAGLVVHRLAEVPDAVDAGAEALELGILRGEALAGRHGCRVFGSLVRRAAEECCGAHFCVARLRVRWRVLILRRSRTRRGQHR